MTDNKTVDRKTCNDVNSAIISGVKHVQNRFPHIEKLNEGIELMEQMARSKNLSLTLFDKIKNFIITNKDNILLQNTEALSKTEFMLMAGADEWASLLTPEDKTILNSKCKLALDIILPSSPSPQANITIDNMMSTLFSSFTINPDQKQDAQVHESKNPKVQEMLHLMQEK